MLSRVFAIILFFIVSCSVGPAYKAPTISVPSTWKNESDTPCLVDENEELDFWWYVFDDEKLDSLEQFAIENNRNLYIACERIQEARALMGVAAADFYPQVNLNPLFTNTLELIKIFNTASSASGAAATPKNVFRVHELLYFLPINLSYEVDLWGRIQDQYQAAFFNWLAVREDFNAVMLNLTTDLATAYFQLRAADTQLDLLQAVLKTREKALQITQDRYDAKITFYADVTLAAEEVGTAKQQYNEILRQRHVLEDQIAVLLGIPASEFTLEHIPLKDPPPCIPPGIPSDVLVRRPDIAEAEYQTRASHALVKEVYTQFFPSLTLTATLGFESPVLREFLKWFSRYWMDGAQVNQLIFDGFRTPYNLQAQIARFREASGEYQELVLTAFQEVEDALTNIESYAKQYETAVKTVGWAKTSYQLYFDRYTLGVTYYIDVVNTEQALLNYQITENALLGFRYLAAIQLIKALGGGWSDH